MGIKRVDIDTNIVSIEEMLQASVNHIARYLFNQIELSNLRNSVMHKVNKNKKQEINKSKKEKSELSSLENTILTKKSVVFNFNIIDVN